MATGDDECRSKKFVSWARPSGSGISRVIIGQDEAIQLLMVALLSEGHVLFEGPPGTGKTLLARAFAACLRLEFKRVQFTPDLMPGDIIGTNLFNFQTNAFTLTKRAGLHRAPARRRDQPHAAQDPGGAARGDAGADGHDRRRARTRSPTGFMVVATQNPIEQEGTYPLPEAQLDRFLFKVLIGYPEPRRGAGDGAHRTATRRRCQPRAARARAALRPALPPGARQIVRGIRLADEMVAYVVDLSARRATIRRCSYGASPRPANMLAAAARAAAVLEGRDFVIPDDVKRLCEAAAAPSHRPLAHAPRSTASGPTRC